MNFRSLVLVCPVACLLAQTPPSQPGAAPPLPKITLSSDVPASAPSVPPNQVVLTIGDRKITAAEFDSIIASLPVQYQSNARGAGRKQFAEQVVRIYLLAEEGHRRKLDETPAYKAQTAFQNANMLAGLTYEQIGKDSTVGAADVQKYYDAHKGEFERVKAKHILIRAQGSPLPVRPGQKDLTEGEALAKAQDIRKKIEAGADFAELARTESDDTSSGGIGGDLGFFGHNQMVPPFEEAAFAMKVGDLSQPVKTPFGYHVIKIEARENKTLEEMKPEIEKKIRPDMASKSLEDLQKNAAVQYNPAFFGPAPEPAPAPTPTPAP